MREDKSGRQSVSGIAIDAFLMSCAARAAVRAATLASFARTDWARPLVEVIDDGRTGDRVHAINSTWRRLLERALESEADFFLLLEDDLEFNRHLLHNLSAWRPLREASGNGAFFGSLYNPQRSFRLRDAAQHFSVAEPYEFWGSQALVLSRGTVGYILRSWDPYRAADILVAQRAAQVSPLYQHVPSLVQHTGTVSTWGGIQHAAADYEPNFRVESQPLFALRAQVVW
jgi:hypothetical protein